MKLDLATLKKTIRVFVYAFLALFPADQLLGVIAGTQVVDIGALRAAAAAGLVAVIAFIWNAVMDPSPIPSLEVKPQDNQA